MDAAVLLKLAAATGMNETNKRNGGWQGNLKCKVIYIIRHFALQVACGIWKQYWIINPSMKLVSIPRLGDIVMNPLRPFINLSCSREEANGSNMAS